MTNYSSSGQADGSDLEPFLDDLLSGRRPAAGAPDGVRGLALVLAAAAAPTRPGELAAVGSASAMFRAAFAAPAPTRRRPVVLGSFAAAAALLLGGVTAAYAGTLPQPVQDFAHRTFGAPASDPGINQPGDGSVTGVPADDPSSVGRPTSVPRATATPPGQVKRTDKATPPGQVKRTDKATPPGQVKRTDKATPPGQGGAIPKATAKPRPTPTNKGKRPTVAPSKGIGNGR